MPISNRLYQYLSAGIGVILCLGIVVYLCNSVANLMFPYAVDYGEAPLIDQANRLLTKHTIYPNDFSNPPYVVSNYPPIYPMLQAGLSYLARTPVLFTGRFLSFTSCIVAAVILSQLARSLTGNTKSGLFAFGIFLAHPYVLAWSPLARVDLLALSFCLAALIILYYRWQSWRWLILASIFLLAAIYTRQSYLLAGPLASITWLWSRDRRRAILFMILLGGAGFTSFLAINWSTQGGFFLNIVQANINTYSIAMLSSWIKQFLTIWPVVIGGVTIFIYTLVSDAHKKTDYQDQFIKRCWLVFTAGSLISALTVGKVGSGANYLMELIAALSLLGAVAIHRIRTFHPHINTGLTFLAFSQLIWLLVGSYIVFTNIYQKTWARLEWYQQVAALVKTASEAGPVLSDDYMGMIVDVNQAIYYQPFEYGQLYQAGLWDPTQLAEEIRQGKFSLILIGGESLNKPCCWPPELVSAIQDRYLVQHHPGFIKCIPGP